MLIVRLKEILAERPDWTQKKLAEVTGIHPTTIAEIANNMRTTINRGHITKIAKALEITDLNQLLKIED